MPRRPKSSTTQTRRESIPRKVKTRSAKRLEEAVNPPKLILSKSSPKKAVKPKPKGEKPKKPTYLVMAKKAIKEMQETSRKGATDVAIVRYIEANYPVYGNFKPRVRLALARAVQAGVLSQNKRHFRVVKKEDKKKAKKTPTKASPSKEAKSPSKKRRASQSKEKSPTKLAKKSPAKEKTRRSSSTKETPTRASAKSKEKVKEKPTRGAASSSTSDASTPSKTTRSTRGASSDANDEELVWAWQFLENDNSYYNYDPAAGDIVEAVYQDYLKAPGATDVRSVKSGQWHYMVDFREMTQQNIQHENHTKRRIRRIQVPASEKSQTRKAYN